MDGGSRGGRAGGDGGAAGEPRLPSHGDGLARVAGQSRVLHVRSGVVVVERERKQCHLSNGAARHLVVSVQAQWTAINK